MTRPLHNGWFGGAVSIRAGSGAERTLRLTRLFRDAETAADFGRGEALRWIASPHAAGVA